MLWGMYWRYLVSIILSFTLTISLNNQWHLLSLIANNNYHPTAVWLFIMMLFLLTTLFQKRGIAYLILGRRLGLADNVWQRFNFSLCLLLFSLAVLGSVVYNFTNLEIWADYKLYGQPAVLLLCPLLATKFSVSKATS